LMNIGRFEPANMPILTSIFKSSWGHWLPTHDARKGTCDRQADSQHTCKPSAGPQ
jgi:hypothetical protein